MFNITLLYILIIMIIGCYMWVTINFRIIYKTVDIAYEILNV